MDSSHQNDDDVGAELSALGVPWKSASAPFEHWLAEEYGAWKFSNEFSKAIPSEWILVTQGDFDLCYLAPEALIMENARRCSGSNLLPIGCLMSGAYLVIDTLDQDRMTVGAVDQIKAMSSDVGELGRGAYHSFALSYSQWLAHIRVNPTDLRYLQSG